MSSLRPDKSSGSNAKGQGEIKRSNRTRGEWGYLVMWEFQVREGMEKRFQKVYGADGDWARFFRQDNSHVTTQLVQASQAERTYLTLDFWTSQQAYEDFRKQHLAKYKALDQKCQELTESEREIGRFVRVPNQ